MTRRGRARVTAGVLGLVIALGMAPTTTAQEATADDEPAAVESAQPLSTQQVATAVASAAARPADQRFDAQVGVLALGPAAIDGLALIAIGEASDEERRIAIWALGELEASAACAAVALVPPSQDPGTEFAAAFANYRCGAPEPLRALLLDEQPRIALKAAIALGLEDDQESVARLNEMAADPTYAEQRVFLDLALGLLGDASTAPTLRELRSTALTRPYAAIALYRIGDASAAIDLRIVVSEHEDPVLRYHAMRELIDDHVEGTRPLLRAASDDPSPRIATMASREARLWDRRRPPTPDE